MSSSEFFWIGRTASMHGKGSVSTSSLVWYPLRPDGFIPFWCCSGPRVFRLPDLRSVIDPKGSAFKRYGRGWIANAPLSLHLKQRVFDAVPTLIPSWIEPAALLKPFLRVGPAEAASFAGDAAGQTKFAGQAFTRQGDMDAGAEADSTGQANASFLFAPFDSKSGSSAKLLPLYRIEETPEDGCIDVSRFSFVPEYYDAVAFCLIHSEQEQRIEAQVPVLGPYGVGLNGKWIVRRKGPFGYVEPEWLPVQLSLRKGTNPVLLFGQMIGWREARIVLGMRILSSSSDILSTIRVGVALPKSDPFEPKGDPSEWKEAEESLRKVGMRQFCFPNGKISLFLGPGITRRKGDALEVSISLAGAKPIDVTNPLPAGRSGGEQEEPSLEDPSWTVRIRNLEEDTEGEERKVILEPDSAFLQSLKKFSPHIPLEVRARIAGSIHPGKAVGRCYIPRYPYADVPYGEYQARKREALAALADMEEEPFGALAGLELQKRNSLGKRVLEKSLDFLRERMDCADFYALSLLAALFKFGNAAGARTSVILPESEQQAVREALLTFKYWHDEPGVDAMCWFTENHQIIFHTAGYLAGSLFPDTVFQNSGLTGAQLAGRSARRIANWILPRLQGGYSEWDSNTYLAMDIYALLALAEFAPSQRIQKLARTLLDKTFFMIACQSIRGAHGCSHGRCYTEGLKTARVESTSGLQRIAWGLGGFNGEPWAAGMLALAEKYQVHPLVQAIGADVPPLVETKSCSYGTYDLTKDLRRGKWEVHTLTRRTPDYLLSAALDHRPGDRGIQEHLWQLTFSPEAVLFSTWPGNSQEHGNARPNYWAGSARLPRVAMEGRTLICLYDPEGNSGLGFGHAYCPRGSLDEVVERESWIFVRYRKGYGALRSDGELSWVRTGVHAHQELRSTGGGRVFLAVAGSEAEDGNFAAFQAKCIATNPEIRQSRVRCRTPEGNNLEFGWEGPFWINGKEEPLRFPWHYQNVYTSTPCFSQRMILQKGNETLTLDLAP